MKDKTYFLIFLFGCIILTIGIIITIILVLTEKKEKKEDDKDDEQCNEDWCNYDCYVYSLFWPPSSCFNKYNGNEECFERVNKLGINNEFIIHGLWPTYISGKYTDTCNKGEEIDIDFDNITYKQELTKAWPGLYYTLDKTMWNHEYNKHGYCYIKRLGKDPENEYKEYFDKGKEKHSNYINLMEQILPDTEKGLHNVTKKKFKQFLFESPLHLDSSYYSLMCNKNDSKKTNVFNEIRFYYGLDFEQINNIKSVENCPDNFQIYFSDENKTAFYNKYDIYIFSLIWNPSTCSKIGKECYKRIKEKELNIFMIHGLWPSYKTGGRCQWCNIGEDIKIEDLPNYLKNNMSNYWVGTYTTDEDLWTNEYNQHGYCYSQRIKNDTSNYAIFFEKTLELYNSFNFKDILKDLYPDVFAGLINLNKSYIIEQLNEKYGIGTFTMTCFKHNDIYLLDEIKFKFSLDFDLTTDGSPDDNCPEDIYAEFLEVEGPQKQADGFYEVYDMYFFTILWLGTTCHMKGKQCYENIKAVPKNIFTMHGLWPNFRNGTLADWCNGKNDIEIEIHDPELLEFMNTHYVSGYHTNPYFWGHEYNKHGYCFNQRIGRDVYDYEYYFNLAKKMYLENDFANIFINMFEEIEPGDKEINRKHIENYLDDHGFPDDTYVIVCTNITQNNETKPHLLEIRIRYDLEFELLSNKTDVSEFDCPDIFYAQFL